MSNRIFVVSDFMIGGSYRETSYCPFSGMNGVVYALEGKHVATSLQL